MSRAEVTEKILSAIDFTMNMTREADPKGGRGRARSWRTDPREIPSAA
jgi:cyanate lyase